MSWLVMHWELKLVALVIAVALWQYTNGQVRLDRPIRVVVQDSAVKALPTDRYQVISIEPREFTVHVSTPSSLEGTFTTDGLAPRLVVAADALDKNRQEFPVGNRVLGLNDDIRIAFDSDTPRSIVVTWDRVEEDYLPVEPPRVQVPPGIDAALALDRTRVRVSGARSRLSELKRQNHRVRYMPLRLDDIDPRQAGPREERLVLLDQDPLVRVIEDVRAVVVLKPRPGSPRTVSVPVTVLAQREAWASRRIELNPEQLTLTIYGPANQLDALDPATDLTAFVRLQPLPDNDVPVVLPVEVSAPAGLSADQATVTVTVRPK